MEFDSNFLPLMKGEIRWGLNFSLSAIKDEKRYWNLRYAIRIVFIPVVALLIQTACAVHRVETSKAAYLQAQEADNAGRDADAILYWKSVRDLAANELQANHYPQTNHFLRASALARLGEWDAAFEDLKAIQPGSFSENESWIYPDYCLLLGDYYSHQDLTDAAENFYQAILKKSTWKSSPIYLLSLERHVSNSIRIIERQANGRPDAAKFRMSEFADLQKEVEKFLEDFPSAGVPHYLLANLLMKQEKAHEALQHYLVAIDFGLPTAELKRSAEFELADLLSRQPVAPELKAALFKKAASWCATDPPACIFRTGQNTLQWLAKQNVQVPDDAQNGGNVNIRYLAVEEQGTLKILLWEKL